MAREARAETRRAVWNMRPQTVNLQAPRTVLQDEVTVFERRMHIKPEVIISGDERQIWWDRAVAAYPPYAEYQERTTRTIPVFVATRR